MNLDNAKNGKIPKPFFNDGKLSITTIEHGHKIVGFRVKYNNKEKTFPVNGEFQILKAWKEVENWLKSEE